MLHIACLACLVITVSGRHNNALGRGSASSRHITKLEQSTFLDTYVRMADCGFKINYNDKRYTKAALLAIWPDGPQK
jgi:hypothetical protein